MITLTFGAPEPPVGPAADGPEHGGMPLLAWVGFGVGGAGLLVGTITGAITLGKAGDLQDQCPDNRCTEDQRDDYDAALAVSRVSTVSFVVGGLGLGVGLVTLLLSGSDDEPPEATGARGTAPSEWVVRPLVGPGLLGVQGRF